MSEAKPLACGEMTISLTDAIRVCEAFVKRATDVDDDLDFRCHAINSARTIERELIEFCQKKSVGT